MNTEAPNQERARSKLVQVYRYLEALNHLRNPVQREIGEQPWAMWLHDLPNHSAVVQGRVVVKELGDGEPEELGDSFLLKVRRPAVTRAPEPPLEIAPWLKQGWQDIDGAVEVTDTQNDLDEQGHPRSIRFEEDARRPHLLAEWSVRREAWLAVERPSRKALAIFERLFALMARLERESERVELVIGDGLLSWRPNGESSIHHPVLLQRVQIKFDPEVPEFSIVEADTGPELYTALFRATPEVQSAALARSREDLEQGGWHPLGGEETASYLRRLVSQLSPHGTYADGSQTSEDRSAPFIRRNPVLFLRTRTLGFATAIEAILDDLKTKSEFARSLTGIVGIEHTDRQVERREENLKAADSPNGEDEQVLLSKPANAEQLEIAQRLDRHGAVLVQGPPGTGKTHTIANILGHLLALGKSVLVTSHSAKALKVLRDKVEEPLQALCVSVLDDSRAQLENSVDAITERLASANADTLEREAAALTQQRVEYLRQLRNVRENLKHARMAEYEQIVIAGVEYSPTDAARLVAARQHTDGWIPSPVSSQEPLPLTAAEFVDLYRTNGSVTAQDEQELGVPLPEPRAIMAPVEFERLLTDRLALSREDLGHGKDLWRSGEGAQAKDLVDLNDRLIQAINSLQGGEAWRLAAIEAGREGGPYAQAWQDLLANIEAVNRQAAEAQPVIMRSGPAVPDDQPFDHQLRVVTEVLEHIGKGSGLGAFTLLLKREWKAFIQSARVQDRAPALQEDFEALRTWIRLQKARHTLRDRWQRQMFPLGAPSANDLGAEPERFCRQFVDPLRICLSWYAHVWQPLEQELVHQGLQWHLLLAEIPADLSVHGDLMRLRRAVTERLPVLLVAESHRRNWRLAELRRTQLLRQLSYAPGAQVAADVVQKLAKAVQSWEPASYHQAFERLVDLYNRREDCSRRNELLLRLEKTAPAWAAAIRERHGVHGQRELSGDPMDAWMWRQLSDELDRRGQASLEMLQARINQLTTEVQQTTALLVDKRAWAAQVRRTTQTQRQALQGWKQLMRRVGKGTGKRVPGLLAEARKLMPVCQSAVPVWIMPISRVVENFDPRRNRFDVVIIDEASQADVMALVALYMGSQVMVVGDDEQVSPVAVGLKVEETERLIDEHLGGIPNYKLYDGLFSIYDLAQTTFEPVCLREHFRCVSPIIQFSNELSYNGKIRPLRDASEIKRKPHTVAYHVGPATSNGKVNETEAIAVASLLISAAEQPEYHDATFGVISMVGEEQAGRVDQLLQRFMSLPDYTKRRVQCGSAAEFQGDERDVVFLSMVDAPTGNGPLTLRNEGAGSMFKKRFNVAASRARDQMWVVHSLNTDYDLKPKDLRLQLIQHAQDPSALVQRLEQQERKAESEFERQVLRRLVQAGYRVTPQWSVGAYRIDIVVEGGGRRLAVECDGDRWHTRENLAEDMARQAILERLGWRFVRIRGSQFFRNPDQAMVPVFARLKDLEIEPQGNRVVDPRGSEAGDALKERIVRRAAELRREWLEAAESEGGLFAASSARQRKRIPGTAAVASTDSP